MTSTPDLVRLSKLDTQFHSDPDYTQHVVYVSGSQFDRWGIERHEKWKRKRRLGRGGFGLVFLEECIHGDKKGELRAVKEIRKEGSGHYDRELHAVALFSHPQFERYFVKSFGWYENEDDVFLSMEYLPGGDLQNYLGSPLPEEEAQCIVGQILEGLKWMHEYGFAHRDLKPRNLLVVHKGPDWWIKIADFGISKRVADEMTALRTEIGTLAFAAPEIFIDHESDDRASHSYTKAVDIWSMGVIAFLILTGETLFEKFSRLSQYVNGKFKFPLNTLLTNNVSEQGCNFIERSMQPDPQNRPQVEECQGDVWLQSFQQSLRTQRQETPLRPQQESPDRSESRAPVSRSTRTETPSASWTTPPETPVANKKTRKETPSASWTTQPETPVANKKTPKETPSASWTTQPEAPVADKKTRKETPSASWTTQPETSLANRKTRKETPSASRSTQPGTLFANRGTQKSPFPPRAAFLVPEPVNTVKPKPKKIEVSRILVSNPQIWRLQRQLRGDSDCVTAIAYSPDGNQILSGSRDSMMRLWDPRAGTLSRVLAGHSDPIRTVAYSPDATQIASGSWDTTIRLWDPATGALLQVCKGHWDLVVAVAYSPDGDRIASASLDKTIRIWDSATGSLLKVLEGHSGSVYAVAYSPNGDQVVSGSWDNTIRLWDPNTGSLLKILGCHPCLVYTVAYSPNGNQVASGSIDATIRLWDPARVVLLRVLKGHSNCINAIVYSPNGNQILSGSDDNTVRLWDPNTGALLKMFEGHSSNVYTVAFSPKGNQIASGSKDGMVGLWGPVEEDEDSK